MTAKNVVALLSSGVVALVTAVAPSFALADPAAGGAPQISVQYDDLSLTTQAGVKRLYSRIKSAARQVCPAADSRDLRRRLQSIECQQAAIARAVSQVDSTMLAAIHAASAQRG